MVTVPMGLSAPPAKAQGFFQSLFGGTANNRPQFAPSRRGPGSGRYSPHGQAGPWWQPRHYPSSRPRSRAYTAMCVRMCDGFYFPVSQRATRDDFYKLARRCQDNCSSEAKLFFMPSTGGEIAQMTDLSGRAYEHIDTAFLYRKKLVKSCTCKPMPWSYSARARHAQYAEDLAEKERRNRQGKVRSAAVSNTDETQTSTNTESPDDDQSGSDADDHWLHRDDGQRHAASSLLARKSRQLRRRRQHFARRRTVVRAPRPRRIRPHWKRNYGGDGNKIVRRGVRLRRR